jgi:class 3 adenylate cyclase
MRAKSILVNAFPPIVILFSTWIGITSWFILNDFSIYSLGCMFTAAVLCTPYDVRKPLYAVSAAVLLAMIYVTHSDLPTFLNKAINPVCVAIVCFMVDRYTMEQAVALFAEKKLVEAERARADRVLYNVLPESIADELKANSRVNATKFENMSILFADIVGFTTFSSKLPPDALIFVLDQIFSIFDELVGKYRLEKIKTIGDAYMVVANNDTPGLARLSLDMMTAMRRYDAVNGADFQLRIGIHVGPAVGGVIGVKRFLYDVWGDTVNIASRMESTGEAGKIQVTDAVRMQLAHGFAFEMRGALDIKGKGMMNTYFLVSEQQPANA